MEALPIHSSGSLLHELRDHMFILHYCESSVKVNTQCNRGLLHIVQLSVTIRTLYKAVVHFACNAELHLIVCTEDGTYSKEWFSHAPHLLLLIKELLVQVSWHKQNFLKLSHIQWPGSHTCGFVTWRLQ